MLLINSEITKKTKKGKKQDYRWQTLFVISFFIIISVWACDTDDGTPSTGNELEYITFVESDADFINPERGFYRYSEARSNNYQNLSVNLLRNYREETTSSGSTYKTYNSLIFRYFILSDFKDQPISQEYLDNIQEDFDVAREAGVKLIPRFTYTVASNAGDCPEGFICPPYGDAPKEIVLQHINQVAPVLSANADVLFALQMGFIGTWGEQYYTDYFGDASVNADQGKLLDENWLDRIEVLEALLNALPVDIMVQVRYPQIKQRAIHGINAPTSVNPLSEEEAFSGTNAARIGFHNDCLFASRDDYGTYADYGNSSSPRRTDINTLKAYFAEDSKWVLVGGETCSDGYSPQNNCAPDGVADEDLRLLHYTYLNADYNNQVNNDWEEGGCMDDIKKNLGYRLVLDSALIPENISTEEEFELDLEFHFRNVGYASPVKDRPVYLVLRGESGNEVFLKFDTDVRFWFENISLIQSFTLPDALTPGVYSLYLFLPDAHESIADRPEYAIRLANEDMWEENTGYNNLNYTIELQ